MLTTRLGKTRQRLLGILKDLPNERLTQKAGGHRWTIAEVIRHVADNETRTARLVFDALQAESAPVADQEPTALRERLRAEPPAADPPAGPSTKVELVRLLEEARFRDLQRVFNKTHESVLLERSMAHPVLGRVSLKNVLDTIWIHEELHIQEIEDIVSSLG